MGVEKVKKTGGGKRVARKPVSMSKKLAGLRVWQLLVLLVVVVGGAVLFVGAASGWFSGGSVVTLDEEYYCRTECDGEYLEISGAEYEGLAEAGKSFVVFVDQGGCTTADRLRGFVKDWGMGAGVKAYRMMFSEVKKSSLGNNVKYYPSVVVVSRGKPVAWLKADSDEDAEAYNNYDAFKDWISTKVWVVEK